MPFTFSHPAVVLPLKVARPRRFSGTALVIGSMAPDFEYFLRGMPSREVGHTIAGQFFFCLPLTLLLVLLTKRILVRPLAAHLPFQRIFHWEDYQITAKTDGTVSNLIKIAACALIGSFSHIIWDSFTHANSWGVERFPSLQIPLFSIGTYTVYIFKLLQSVSTIFGAALIVGLLYKMGSERWILKQQDEDEIDLYRCKPTKESRRLLGGSLLAGGAAGVLAFLLRSRNAPSLLDLGVRLFLRVTLFAFIGLCVGCAFSSKFMRVEK